MLATQATELFHACGISEQAQAPMVVRLPPIAPLHARLQQPPLTLLAMCHMLKQGLLSRNHIDCSEWVLQQLQLCTTPIHPLVPQLINVSAMASSTRRGRPSQQHQ